MSDPNFKSERLMAGLVFSLSSSAFYTLQGATSLQEFVFGGYAFIGVFLVLLSAASLAYGVMPRSWARWQWRTEVLERVAVSSDGATVLNRDVDGEGWRRYLRVRREDMTVEEYWLDEISWHLCPPGTIVDLKVLGRKVVESRIVKRAPKPGEEGQSDAAD